MENRAKTQAEIEQEMLELNEQFAAFLNTKGITAKFKLAFNNMSESLNKQHAQDIAEFEAVKAQSAEDNRSSQNSFVPRASKRNTSWSSIT